MSRKKEQQYFAHDYKKVKHIVVILACNVMDVLHTIITKNVHLT